LAVGSECSGPTGFYGEFLDLVAQVASNPSIFSVLFCNTNFHQCPVRALPLIIHVLVQVLSCCRAFLPPIPLRPVSHPLALLSHPCFFSQPLFYFHRLLANLYSTSTGSSCVLFSVVWMLCFQFKLCQLGCCQAHLFFLPSFVSLLVCVHWLSLSAVISWLLASFTVLFSHSLSVCSTVWVLLALL